MDYTVYRFNKYEKLLYGCQSVLTVIGVSYLMYGHMVVSLCCLPLAVFVLKGIRKRCLVKRRKDMLIAFKEFLYSLVLCLSAGYSIENSMGHIIRDLALLYPEGHYLIDELKVIQNRMSCGASFQSAFQQLSDRMALDEIDLFIASIEIGQEQGGNLIEVLTDNSRMIIDQAMMTEEIHVLTAEKRLELKFLTWFPFGVIGLLNYSSPAFMSVLYTTWAGRMGMTLAFGMIGFGIFIGRRMVAAIE